MADGSMKAIEDVVVGDLVLSDDPTDDFPPNAQEVAQVHKTSTYRLFHIQVSGQGGGEVLSTGRHPFWTQRGWVAAEELVSADLLMDSAGMLSAIDSIAIESRDTPTFNLSVKNVHTYFVVAGKKPLLVHNVDPWDIWFSQDNYGPKFSDGKPLTEVAGEARALGHLPDGLKLNVMQVNNNWVTLNNRTLAVARMANLPDVAINDVGVSGTNKLNQLLRDSGLVSPVETAVMRCQ
jgi:hypothetical protein